MILTPWFHYLEDRFSYKEVKFKMFCPLVKKNSCSPAENVNEIPADLDVKFRVDRSRLPCHVVPVKGPSSDKFDCYVLVCENLEWSNPEWDFLKTPILEAAKVCERHLYY